MIEGSTLGFNVIHGLPTFGGSACQDNDATGLASGGLPHRSRRASSSAIVSRSAPLRFSDYWLTL